MRVINATMPRSGSEFVSKLVRKICGARIVSTMSLTPARKINYFAGDDPVRAPEERDFKDWIRNKEATDFFNEYNDILIKIEAPGKDLLCLDLASKVRDLKWVFSVRSPENIIESHYNLQKWGWSEERILDAYKNDLCVYEYIAKVRGIYGIDVNDPSAFDMMELCEYLGVSKPSAEAVKFVKGWWVVNPLSQQKERSGEEDGARAKPPGIDTLRLRHPWIDSWEARMKALCGPTSRRV